MHPDPGDYEIRIVWGARASSMLVSASSPRRTFPMSRFNASTNPWPAKALATATRRVSLAVSELATARALPPSMVSVGRQH